MKNIPISTLIDYCFGELSSEEIKIIENEICNDTYLFEIVVGIYKVKDEHASKKFVIEYFKTNKEKGILELEQFIDQCFKIDKSKVIPIKHEHKKRV